MNHPRTRTLIHRAPPRPPFPVAVAEAFDGGDGDLDLEATHPHMPNFKDQEPIHNALIYDVHGYEDGYSDIAVVTNIGTNPALPPHRVVINIAGVVSVCLTLAQSAILREQLQIAEIDAAPALALVGVR